MQCFLYFIHNNAQISHFRTTSDLAHKCWVKKVTTEAWKRHDSVITQWCHHSHALSRIISAGIQQASSVICQCCAMINIWTEIIVSHVYCLMPLWHNLLLILLYLSSRLLCFHHCSIYIAAVLVESFVPTELQMTNGSFLHRCGFPRLKSRFNNSLIWLKFTKII